MKLEKVLADLRGIDDSDVGRGPNESVLVTADDFSPELRRLQNRQRFVTAVGCSAIVISGFLTVALGVSLTPFIEQHPALGPLAALPLAIAGLLIYIFSALASVILRRPGIVASRSGFSVYCVGETPYRPDFLIIKEKELILAKSGVVTFAAPLGDIDVVGVANGSNAIQAVISFQEGVLLLNIAGKLGGPFALGWSFDGIPAWSKLRREFSDELERRGIPTAQIS